MEFNTIWNTYNSHLLNFVKSKIEDKIHAEDILQEIGLKLYAVLNKGEKINNYKSWLFQVARNLIIDYYRKEKVKKNRESTYSEINDEGTCVCDLSSFVIQNYLPKKYGIPLYKSDIEKKSQKVIANELNISLPAAKSRIQRARVKLKELIEECVTITYNKNGTIVDYQLKNTCEIPKELQEEIKRINLTL